MMNIKRNTAVSVMITFCFTATLFMMIPTRSATSPYDPWIDSNDDCKIGLQDLVLLANSYNTNGTSLTKASIQYDSGWINITDKCGQNIVITHNLNSTDLIVDIQGKNALDSGPHQRNYGLTGCVQGWNRTYGETAFDEASTVVKTNDGGYALAGGTNSFSAGGFDSWLVKTDANGNMQWNRTCGGTNTDWVNALVQTADGGYALAGLTASFGAGGYDFWLVKTDASGSMQWNKTYGGTGDDWGLGLVQTDDGGYALVGYTTSFGSGNHDSWLVKTDASGSMQWNKTYGGTGDDWGLALVQTADGGYALAGYTYSSGAGSSDFWLVRTDAFGSAQWNKTYGGALYDEVHALVQTSDGGYALAGLTASFGAGGYDFWLVKTDASGSMQWNKTYGGTGDDWGLGLVQTDDGGYAVAGTTTSPGASNEDFWLVKTDANGNMQWNRTYGGTNTDWVNALVQTADGGYALAGYTYSFGAGVPDFWLIRTDASGNIGGVESGLAWFDSSANTITLYRGATDVYWNFVRVWLWMPKTP